MDTMYSHMMRLTKTVEALRQKLADISSQQSECPTSSEDGTPKPIPEPAIDKVTNPLELSTSLHQLDSTIQYLEQQSAYRSDEVGQESTPMPIETIPPPGSRTRASSPGQLWKRRRVKSVPLPAQFVPKSSIPISLDEFGPDLWTLASTERGLSLRTPARTMEELLRFLQDFAKSSGQEDNEDDNEAINATLNRAFTAPAIAKDNEDSDKNAESSTSFRLTVNRQPGEAFGRDSLLLLEYLPFHPSTSSTIQLSASHIQTLMLSIINNYFEYRCCSQHRTPILERRSFYLKHCHETHDLMEFERATQQKGDSAVQAMLSNRPPASLLLKYSMCTFIFRQSYLFHGFSNGLHNLLDANAVEAMEQHLLAQSRLLLQECFDEPSLAVIQSLIHLHYYESFRGRTNIAYLYLGIAIRMAGDLGWFVSEDGEEIATFGMQSLSHALGSDIVKTTVSDKRTGSPGPSADQQEVQLTKYKVLFLDFYAAFHWAMWPALGTNHWSAVNDLSMQSLHDSLIQPEKCPDPVRAVVVNGFLYIMKLTNMLQRIMEILYAERSRNLEHVVASGQFAEMMEELVKWKASLPEYFRLRPQEEYGGENTDINHEERIGFSEATMTEFQLPANYPQTLILTRLLLHKYFHMNRIVLLRPFLPVDADTQTPASSELLDICRDSAHQIRHLAMHLVRHHTCHLNFRAIFFACQVFHRQCLLFKGDEAMRKEASDFLAAVIYILSNVQEGVEYRDVYLGMLRRIIATIEAMDGLE
ncbi:hypothetical protein BZG36_02367 [Bifiguratus adelaidae]|uniref:Xylanolytic transcriptional activator regulatory domain-containing protein n=1 Tax=Bifiguratus adelaidae TaxID=1938954 RepID=A0A261Y196_9FUNG|nr:hypothetical protein BZG36_02367 [Bifiguratus adelaidae]